MAGVIRNLKNPFTGKYLFPVTKTRAIFNEDGSRLDNYLNSLYGSPSSNLLINSNFANLVNQRGETTKNTDGYWIDRWALLKTVSSTEDYGKVKDGYISIFTKANSLATCHDLEQKVEFPKTYIGKWLTASCKYRVTSGGTATMYARFSKSDGNRCPESFKIKEDLICDGKWHIATMTFKVESAYEIVSLSPFMISTGTYAVDSNSWISPSVDTTLDIEWAKVEIGTVATPYVPRLYAEELQLCQRYFQIRSTNTLSEVDMTPSMRTTPIIKTFGSNYSYDAEL